MVVTVLSALAESVDDPRRAPHGARQEDRWRARGGRRHRVARADLVRRLVYTHPCLDDPEPGHRVGVDTDGEVEEDGRDPVVGGAVGVRRSSRDRHQGTSGDVVWRLAPRHREIAEPACDHGEDDVIHRPAECLANGADVIQPDRRPVPSALGPRSCRRSTSVEWPGAHRRTPGSHW